MYQCLTQKDTLLYIIKSGVYRWPALKIKQHQNLVFHLNRHCLLPKNGATPNFVEFKDENENVVASISTSGDLNVTGSITVNGEEVPVGPAFSPATPTFTGPTTINGSLIVNGSTIPTITVSSATPSGGTDGDVWLVQY